MKTAGNPWQMPVQSMSLYALLCAGIIVSVNFYYSGVALLVLASPPVSRQARLSPPPPRSNGCYRSLICGPLNPWEIFFVTDDVPGIFPVYGSVITNPYKECNAEVVI